MSRRHTGNNASFSSTQRKAVVVLLCCILAIILTMVGAFQLPRALGIVGSIKYDPELYPVDKSLGAVLTETADAGSDYLASTVLIGDQYIKSLQTSGQITLNQFAGAEDFSIKDAIRTPCVNFAADNNSYTIPQAIAMMKPRRVIVTFGSNDAATNTSTEEFIMDYKQTLQSIAAAYPYCDILVNSIAPVVKGADGMAEKQLLIDRYNQALAQMCDSEGYKFLNSAESLKTTDGYAESAYFDSASGTFNGAGATQLLSYIRTHAYDTEDRRPDTKDVPQRAGEASTEVAQATPSPTPLKYAVTYSVEEGRGTLTGNGQSNVSSITMETDPKATVSVTAIAADGYSFYKWSDGQTEATRYDVITQDLSVTAMFNDARVDITLDRENTTMNLGESISTTATVKLGDKDYDNSNVQWSVNDDLQGNMGTFTYTATEPGSFTVKAGLEINGTYASQTFTVTVQAPPTTITIAGPQSMHVGETTSLSATVQNLTGDITWSCDQKPEWMSIGQAVQFTADMVGSYTIHANANGASADFTLIVIEAAVAPTPDPNVPTPAPATPEPAPATPEPAPEDQGTAPVDSVIIG